jgi:DNA-binding transcriptional ArsR family regulator
MLNRIKEEYAGIHGARDRTEENAQVGKPACVTTKCVRQVLEKDERLGGTVGLWENYGNVNGSNELKDAQVAALLGTQHYGDAQVEKFAALAGETATHTGHGNALEYGSDVADEYLGHMREDQVMQAALRFARGDTGALVFARTSALRDDLPVVGSGKILRSWSKVYTQVAQTARRLRGREFTVSDVAEHVDASRRQIQRALNEFTDAGYVEKHETGEGVANSFERVSSPGAGEVDVGEVDAEPALNRDSSRLDISYTVNVGVPGLRDPSLPAKGALTSALPSPDGSRDALAEGDPPE